MRMSSRLPIGLAFVAVAALAVPARAADADKYLPNNSEAVLTINVRTLLDAALVKRNLEQLKPTLKNNTDYQKMIESLGLDPFTDIDKVLIGGPGGADADKAVFVIQGKFNVAKMQAVAVKEAKDNADHLKIEKVGNTELYEINPPGRNQKTTFAALLDDKFLVGSPHRESVVDAIEKKAGSRKAELKKSLVGLLEKQDPKQAMSIVATSFGAQGELADLLKNATGGFTIDEDIKMDFKLAAKDEKSATTVADKLKDGLTQALQIVGVLGLKDKRFASAMEVVKSIKIDTSESTVSIKGEVSKDVVEKLEKMAKEGNKPPKKKDKDSDQ